jgi:nicotinamide-nucleotide amidase
LLSHENKSVPLFPPRKLYQKAAILSQKLVSSNLTVATAESLTGGLVSASLTSISGSSRYFLAGLNTYSNESKHKLLEVPLDVLETDGAVSEKCSVLMAKNVARIIGSNIGISTTGIAGPDGGSAKKPVGLVYFSAYEKTKGLLTWEKRFSGMRHEITLLSVETALDIFLELLS